MELNGEMIKKARTAKNAEELMRLAKENGIEMTPSEAEDNFDKLNPTLSGELSDDDLDDVAGGGCGKGKKKPASKFEIGACVCITALKNSPMITRYSGTVKSKKYSNDTWVYGVDRGVGEESYREDELE